MAKKKSKIKEVMERVESWVGMGPKAKKSAPKKTNPSTKKSATTTAAKPTKKATPKKATKTAKKKKR